jgi:hypothetical protein
MSTEILVSLIALSGVIVSVVISYLASQRQIRTEINNSRLQIEHAYATKLFENRFNTYPQLFEITSSFAAKIRYGVIKKTDLDAFLEKIHVWDSKNSIFLSAITTKYLFRVIRLGHELQNSGNNALARENLSEKFIPLLADLELSLKTELGVFSREDFHNPTEVKTLDDVIIATQKQGGKGKNP